MFRHIYFNRLKCLSRDRGMVFWTLLYPIVLAVFFYMAFSNLGSADVFTSIPVAVVDNGEYQSQPSFQSALKQVSTSEDRLFDVRYLTREQAEESLDSREIEGYILFENGAHVVFNSSGIRQSIIKEFVDSYVQTASAYTTILSEYPGTGIDPGAGADRSYFEQITFGSTASPDPSAAYFYALIAMAALFGSFWGKKEVEDIQADMSDFGARMNLVPVHKMKTLFYSFCAAVTIHFLAMIILVAFLQWGLQVEFGPQLGFMLIACLFSSLVGVSFGALLAAIIRKGSVGFRTAVMIALSLALSSLAGLNNISVKYTVTHAVPAMAYLNPANVIADAFYALYYYTTYDRFFLNMGLLLGMSVIFLLVVYLTTRRQKYASI